MVRWLLILAVLILGSWAGGLVWFGERISAEHRDSTKTTDAIVVLTGGRDRLQAGLDLLAQNLGQKLFISGVHEQVKKGELIPVAALEEVDLGYDASSTIENARETAQWMQKNNFKSLRLVTANYHMPRSLLEFEQRLPEIEIVPNPVTPKNFQVWWHAHTFPLVLREYHKYLGALCRYFLKSTALQGMKIFG